MSRSDFFDGLLSPRVIALLVLALVLGEVTPASAESAEPPESPQPAEQPPEPAEPAPPVERPPEPADPDVSTAPPAPVTPAPVPATTPPESEVSKVVPERNLGGHIFPFTNLAPSSFILSHFSYRQGFLKLDADDFPLTADKSEDVGLVGLSEDFQVGGQLFHRLELFGLFGAQVLSGIGATDVLALGSTYGYYVGAGAAVKVLRSDKSGSQVSLRGHATTGSGGSFDFLTVTDELTQANAQTVDAVLDGELQRLIVKDTSRREAAGHILYAQSLHRNVGLQVALGVSWTDITVDSYNLDQHREVSNGASSVGPEGSLGLDVDLMPSVPIGFIAEYTIRKRRYEITSSSDSDLDDVSHLFSLGVHSVNEHFQLGLAMVQIIGLGPFRRTDNNEELESKAPTLRYIQLSIHANF